jgi:hypothetical protein
LRRRKITPKKEQEEMQRIIMLIGLLVYTSVTSTSGREFEDQAVAVLVEKNKGGGGKPRTSHYDFLKARDARITRDVMVPKTQDDTEC